MPEKKNLWTLIVILSLFVIPGVTWAGTVPSSTVIGKYGFDWLRPTKA